MERKVYRNGFWKMIKELDIETKLPHPSVPLKKKSILEELCETNPFNYSSKTLSLFVEAMRYTCVFQYKNSKFIKKYYDYNNFDPSNIKKQSDLLKIPYVHVSAFKERELTTLKSHKIVLELKSSGTSGQRSRIQLDLGSLLRVRRMAWNVFYTLGLCDIENKYDYICFTYDPEFAGDIGTAWTDKLITSFTLVGEVFYCFKWDEAKNDFYFDIGSAVMKIRQYEEKNSRVRLIGFPAFVLKLTEEYKKRFGRYPKLNQNSFVITGGGWKTLENEAIDKSVFRKILSDNLSIPVENIRDLFGMVEHGVAYVDCKYGNFHIPIYGKIVSLDPYTLKPLKYSKKGLLEFITPYLTSYPSFVLLSTDWGKIIEGCDCGLDGPVLQVLGRAGIVKHKGCAISASEKFGV
ncbi:MAG: hypothetical protein N2446_03595 [Elusimicrobiales bacterium]|nr:hypothetical protein [Elusimicrobiales bacterium]